MARQLEVLKIWVVGRKNLFCTVTWKRQGSTDRYSALTPTLSQRERGNRLQQQLKVRFFPTT
jgi:hypothetical protein